MQTFNIKYFMAAFCCMLFFFTVSCEKQDESPVYPMEFISLEAEKMTGEPAEEIQLTAHATGHQLSYHWEASSGNILGSGSAVVFVASACCPGDVHITCTVKDKHHNAQTKTLTLKIMSK